MELGQAQLTLELGKAQLTLELGQAQLTLGRKMASTFASSKNIIHQLPNNKN